jgi:hypothetical protein
MLSPVQLEVVESDPRGRAKIRYPIRMNLRYSLFRRKRVLKTGRGTTINMSSSGILFEAEESLPPGYIVHLAIGWPGTIDDRAGLVLHITARTVRGQGNSTAAVIVRHEFHVRSLRDAEGRGVGHRENPPLAVATNDRPSFG